jgi:type II secretory pathway component PulF
MIFNYTASTKEGKIIKDRGEFKDASAVLEYIKNQGWTPLNIREVRVLQTKLKRSIFSTITLTDKIFLAKYLSLMLKSGTNLFKAIDILINDFKKPSMKSLLMEVRDNLEKGRPFYTTFEKYPRIFSSVFINMVKAGETSGNLDKTFSDLTLSLEKERSLKQKIKSALIYPILLILASFGILILLVTFAIPRISTMFRESNIQVPAVTKIIFGISDFFSNYGGYIALVLIILVLALFVIFKFTSSGRLLFNRLIFKIPVVKNILNNISYQRFSSTFGSLMKAGLPILENLRITAFTTGNNELRNALLRISDEGLSRGYTLGESFNREEIFPQTIRTLISVGEQAGHTEEILDTLSDFYEAEIDIGVKTLVSLVEPIMLLFIGVIVGGIALAVVLPIYQFVGQVGAGI